MNVAFIPVRGGSKSIPMKNIKLLNGKPLVYWVAKAACECKYIDMVYVASDSIEIREAVSVFCGGLESDLFSKLRVIDRSSESASDVASTELAMIEFANSFEFDVIALIQATSPLLSGADLEKGFELFKGKDTDSVLSVVRQKRFNWEIDSNGNARSMNYDPFHRPRRQEIDGYLVENGAFYITSKKDLLETGNRISGRIKAVEMDEESYFEIDEPSDWVIIEELLKNRQKKEVMANPEIKLFLTDCDGCLTDGGMYYSEHGDEMKKFNTRDGVGFAMLRERGIITGIITGEKVELNRRRAEKLQVDIIEMGCSNKLERIKQICDEYGMSLENVCYVGDDVNDIDAIKAVGMGCAPCDAVYEVRDVADVVLMSRGGKGVVREMAECLIEQDVFFNG